MSNDPSIHIMRSQLGRARGLGASKTGVHHWWAQRITAVALLPLSLYFVVSVLILDQATRLQVIGYLAEPWNTVLFLCLIAAMFYHLQLGVQVIIEDYVHGEGPKLATVLAVNGVIIFCALAAAVSILKLAF
jgi:succinate dehydrogenase / fumarate reductase membrane anchor subunit